MSNVLGKALRELRYSLRLLARSPGLSVTVVLVVAVGIGGVSAVYSMAREVLWPDLPGRKPDRLVTLYHRHLRDGYYSSFALPQVDELAGTLDSLAEVTGYLEGTPVNLGGETGPVQRAQAAVVDGDYFRTLGLEAAAGRLLDASDDTGDDVVVLSHALWAGRYGGDPAVVGSTVELDGSPFRVVGVAPTDFRGADYGAACDLWVSRSRWRQLLPWMSEQMLASRGSHWLSVIGRLAPGVGLDAARAEIAGRAAAFADSYPDTDASWDILVQPYRQGRLYPGLQEDVYGTLGLLATVVLLVLAVVCANVANLLLARNRGRAAEMAVRRALGARRGDLVRQSIIESQVLALLGGVGGLLLAAWAVDLLGGIRPTVRDPLVLHGTLDPGVVGFAFLLCLLTGALFGLPAAWRSSDRTTARSPDSNLPASTGSAHGRLLRRLDVRDALAAAQIAVCLALVVSSILLQRSLWNRQASEPGFDPRGVLLAAVDLDLSGYDTDDGLRLFRRLRERLEAQPQVESASMAAAVPLDRWRMAMDVGNGQRRLNSGGNVVGPRYLSTLRIRLLRGRELDDGDGPSAPPVAIVNETLAQALWPEGGALDRTLDVYGGSAPLRATVVGVIADGIYGRELESRHQPFFLLPAWQRSPSRMIFHVRGRAGSAAGLEEVVRQVLAELDPDVPAYDVRTLSDHLDTYLARSRAVALHASLFGALALILSAIGTYGVISYRVGERGSEIGVRLAVGARRADIVRMVLSWAATLAGVGLALGLLASYLLRGTYASLLYGVVPFEPLTCVEATAFLAAVVLAAAWLPARRAARLDPARTLRGE